MSRSSASRCQHELSYRFRVRALACLLALFLLSTTPAGAQENTFKDGKREPFAVDTLRRD